MKRLAKFLPQFDGFGLSDSEWKKINRSDMSPSFWLSSDDYQRLGVSVPKKNAPVIGLLFGREDGHYCSDWNYVLSLAKAGAAIMFLDYENHRSQLADCDALVLPGGAFASPEKFYTDAKTHRLEYPTQRSQAYVESIIDALKYRMPILGICAGAQMMAGVAGMKLYRSGDYFESPIEHRTSEEKAHRIWFAEGTPFASLMGNRKSMIVNSRHSEFLAPERVQREELRLCEGDSLPLDIYATATDGIPEAWGDMQKGILCVQWHPEDFADAGKLPYKWVVDMASIHH
ncbi:MAG: gamma-glutamyl-gamma-aminobutyrate hydrolase family protein [Alphaproteobacteria bacterium]|nr:gamma-glutamyl-gamma-aminobutyrate hydrolase family protein [Alphaproteobacteria bacterium]